MTGSFIGALGYVGLTTPDVDAWRQFAEAVLGLAISPRSDSANLLLRMDERAWRLSVEPGDGGLAYAGWEVAGPGELREVVAALEGAGVAVKEDPELARRRLVRELVRCEDPGGTNVEIFHGALVEKAPFASSRGTRFVTSAAAPGDMGMGHIVLSVPDAAEARAFYLGILGFRVADTATVHGTESTFTFVNPRHHSLAFVELPGPSQLHHFMLEVEDVDMVGRALDAVLDGAAQLCATLGRHTNDHMLSFYASTPSGCQIEYGCGGRRLDPSRWLASSYDAANIWGHRQVGPAVAV